MGMGALWSGDYFVDKPERIITVAVWGEILPYFSLSQFTKICGAIVGLKIKDQNK